MHENREISCTSWTKEQDRSAKAINQTADMNVEEKSDCAVVPVNQPNKEGQPSAEVGKGRAQTEENIAPSHMRPTQSGMSQGLGGVRHSHPNSRQILKPLLHSLGIGSEPAPVDHVSILVDRAIVAPDISPGQCRWLSRLGNVCSELPR